MSGIISKKALSLKVADEIASAAIEVCKRNAFKPISVCVMDPSGYAIVTKRMDDCPVSLVFANGLILIQRLFLIIFPSASIFFV